MSMTKVKVPSQWALTAIILAALYLFLVGAAIASVLGPGATDLAP